MERTVDRTEPKGKWAFDASVTAAFDDMLERSIPQHEIMRRACFDLACRHAREGTTLLDLGCSRGAAMAPLIERFGALVRHVGVEVSEPMIEAARERFAGYIKAGVVEVRNFDLRGGFPPERASVVQAVLTFQFVPMEHRLRILHDCHRCLLTGGCLLLVEKVLGATSPINEAMVAIYHELKIANGYSRDDVDRKRLALEGVLVPLTAEFNERMLAAAGFRQVDCFWRWMNFAGWVAIKE